MMSATVGTIEVTAETVPMVCNAHSYALNVLMMRCPCLLCPSVAYTFKRIIAKQNVSCQDFSPLIKVT